MGVGDSLEAPYVLKGPLAAGRWKLVGDGIALEAADVRYEVIWRNATRDMPIVQFRHHFDPVQAAPFKAIGYDEEADGVAAAAVAGDQLVLRFSIASTHPAGTKQWVPNADGSVKNGRIPSLLLP